MWPDWLRRFGRLPAMQAAKQQLDPLLFFVANPVKIDLYSDRSQTLTDPFSSIDMN
jgi:hypothetical protein